MNEPVADAATDGLKAIFARIPLAAAMQLRIAKYGDGRLVLAAPFEPNRNHAGIAFGGAIECIATLAGWGLLWLRLARPDAEIVVHRSETRFAAPLTGELRATAAAPPPEKWRQFVGTLARRGRGRIEIGVTVGDAGNRQGAEFRGGYVVTAPAGTRQRPAG